MTEPQTEMVTCTGDEAIDKVMNLGSYCCTVREEGVVWDCDLASDVGEDSEADFGRVFWMCLLYRKEKDVDRISFRFFPNIHGEADLYRESVLNIQTGDPGEPASTSFIFTPIRED